MVVVVEVPAEERGGRAGLLGSPGGPASGRAGPDGFSGEIWGVFGRGEEWVFGGEEGGEVCVWGDLHCFREMGKI